MSPTALTVAVVTYRRPGLLDGLLAPLEAQCAEVAASHGLRCDVLVVDNDPQSSAREVVARHPGVRYEQESTPGIAAARNRVLDVTAGTELLVFIDDDETPSEGWLAALVDAQSATGACAISGAVVSEFDEAPPSWVLAGGFFARRHRDGVPFGAEVDTAASNNLLLDRAQLDRTGVRFDVDFGLSGGSDTLFSRALVARGARIVWCPAAVVVEQVPVSRLTRRWLLTRAASYGATDCRVAVRLAPGPAGRLRARARCLASGSARVGVGALRYVLGTLRRSERDRAVALQTLLRGLGLVGAVFGYTYQRYRRSST